LSDFSWPENVAYLNLGLAEKFR